MRGAVALIAILMSAALATWAQAPLPIMSPKEAEPFCRAALSRATKNLPGLTLDLQPQDKQHPRCANFNIFWSNLRPGSAHVDFYWVDRRTGEVWSGPITVCHRVSTKPLVEMQQRLRKRLGVTEEEHRKVTTENPCCFDAEL